MAFQNQNILSKLTILFVLIAVVFTQFSQQKWNEKNGVISGDVKGYYAYLPALFINNDINFENVDVYLKTGESQVWYTESENGTRYIKYTCGMSILYSPFFFMAHLYATFSSHDADGFSWPYCFALAMSSIFFLFIALYFMSKLLHLFFRDGVVAITLLIIFAGTNAFHYYTDSMTYSHGYSLALISAFLYTSTRWNLKPKLGWAVWMGICAGLMVLIRPIDLIFLLYIILFNVNSLDALKERFKLVWKNRKHVLAFSFCFFLMILPQLIYFKAISGSFIFYSYTKESFFFSNPHILDSLFSYRNGWLLYSPIMIFSLVGVFFLSKLFKNFGLASVLIFVLYLYVISAWWCWWYVGFGNRAFINLYPILSFSLAAFVASVLEKGVIVRFSFKLIVFALILLNAFQTYQFTTGAIHWDAMSKEAYWNSFGRETPSQLFLTKLQAPNPQAGMAGINEVTVYVADTLESSFVSFENSNALDSVFLPFLNQSEAYKGSSSVFIPKNNEYALSRKIPVKGADHLYASAWVKNSDQLFLAIGGTANFPYYALSGEVVATNKDWSQVHLYAAIPEELRGDSVQFYVWKQNKQEYWLDNFRVLHLRTDFKSEILD